MLQRFAVRSAVIYLFLYWLPTPLDNLPGKAGEFFADATEAIWRPVTELTGKLLSLEVPPLSPTGSGDTLAAWLRLLAVIILSLVLGALWALDQRRTRHEAVLDFTRDYLRLCLAVMMLAYGMGKVLVQQFPAVDEYTAFTTYGDSSPMGLLWRFMGFSSTYERFTGFAECLGGVLLFSRRTTTAGALVIAGVMTNVVLLNFCFDVPVKIGSTHYLIFALGLLAPDARRLLNVLFTNQPTSTRDFTNKYAPGRAQFVMPVLIVGFGALIIGSSLTEPSHEELHASPGGFEGAYAVVGQSGGLTWHFVQFMDGAIEVKRGANKPQFARMKVDAQTLTVGTDTLTWEDHDGLRVLKGTWDQEPVELTLQRLEVAAQPLHTRGFHWVSEFPFNR